MSKTHDNGIRDFQKVSCIGPSTGDEFSGDDIFYTLHLALENLRRESLDGVDHKTDKKKLVEGRCQNCPRFNSGGKK